jgi:hypothetical protein
MAKKNRPSITGTIDCACVIHGSGYSWEYVEKLYNMLMRVFENNIRFHVYTEHDRSVPPHMIKHILDDWGISGPKKSWWYKIQLFNPQHYDGNMLYFDLDMVIVRELDFIRELDPAYFWSIRDFRYLQRPALQTVNSSVMWFNVPQFADVWQKFTARPVDAATQGYPGDQDYIAAAISHNRRRFFQDQYFESYRWQCLDGGYDFSRRHYRQPSSGVNISPNTAAVVFHGTPKPHQVTAPVIQQLWK